MKCLSCIAFCAALVCLSPAFAGPVGFSTLSIADGANPPVEIGIWYPTEAAPRPTRIETFVQPVAADAPVAGTRLPLVVISHGNGGSFSSHADTAYALAEAGFVAAALTHTGDNYRDQSRAVDMHNRPRQLAVLIDYMMTGWPPHPVDPGRVGAFGFSSGGFTVLAAAGGNPDFALIGPHCAEHPDFFDCRLVAQHGQNTDDPQIGQSPPFAHDSHLRAIVVAAPALGFTFAGQGLANITMPVQLWRAADDRILPSPFYVEPVAAALPHAPELHVVDHAGHFDFLAPCSDILAAAAPMICTSEPGFDRTEFHRDFDAAIVAFFQRTLKPGSEAVSPPAPAVSGPKR